MGLNYTTYDYATALNYTNGTATAMFAYGNTVTGNWLSPMLILIVAVISYLALQNPMNPRKGTALGGSAMFTFIVAVTIYGMGQVDIVFVLMSLLYLLVSIYISKAQNSFG